MKQSELIPGMAKLSEVVGFLEKELNTEGVPDYPGAYNGLQLQNGGEVRRVACAVDASQPVIEKAVAKGADLLVVHHGMFWQGVRMLTGSAYTKLKICLLYTSPSPRDGLLSRMPSSA